MTTSFKPTRRHPVRRTIKTINIEPELISNEEGPVAKIEEAMKSIEAQLELYDWPKFAYVGLNGALAHLALGQEQIKVACWRAQREVEVENRQTQSRQQQKQKLTLVRPDGTIPR